MIWATGTAVALLLALGVPLAWAVGLKGYWLIGAAPAFAVTMIAGTSVIAPWVGLRWSLLPVVLVSAVVGAAILATRLALRRRHPADTGDERPRPRVDFWLIGAIVLAASVIGFRVMEIIGAPENISQTFDNIFHLNGVRFAMNEGNASPLHLGYMTSPDGSLPFYPSAWHAFTSLVAQLTGVSIPIAVNAVVLATSAFIWPVSVLLLTRTLFGAGASTAIATAVVAASIPAFPILLMDYGVLYPYQLGLALLPAALAATLQLLRMRSDREPSGFGWWVLILLGMLPALAIAHPGALVAWLALSVPMAVGFGIEVWRGASARLRILVAAAFAAYLVCGVLLIRVLRPPLEARLWPTQMSMVDAFRTVATVSMWYLVPALVVAAALLAGAIWALIDGRRAGVLALSMYLVAAGLFVAVAALPWQTLRDALTGGWYNNLPRLAAILAIAIVPLAAYGIARTWMALTGNARARKLVAGWPGWARAAVGVATAVILLICAQAVVMPGAVSWAKPLYVLGPYSPLLTTDEYELLTRLPAHVPEGVVVAGSPWTGASLAYAIGDRPVLMPHTLMHITPEIEMINEGLDTASADSAACRAVRERGVGFIVDFGAQEVHPGEHLLPGFDDLAGSDSVRLVDEQGTARLYEVVACGR